MYNEAVQAFDYVAPVTLGEAVSALAGQDREARVLAGGTDLLVQLRDGRKRAQVVVDIKRIPELTAVRFDPHQGLVIGAAATCDQICRDPAVLAHYPGLLDAVGLIGGIQIQSRASLGGNLCNASPAADSIPALIVHEAICTIAGAGGMRSVPAGEFCQAPGQTVLERGELLVSISLPVPGPGFGAGYLRFIPRNEMDIAEAGAAAGVVLEPGGRRFASARIALAAVAPTPLLVEEAGEYLAGRAVTAQAKHEAARLAAEAARPISDLRGTAEHRRHLCAVLTARALERAIDRARVPA
jgi:CO/xanthine dehydrogenase FAD-binding subunit